MTTIALSAGTVLVMHGLFIACAPMLTKRKELAPQPPTIQLTTQEVVRRAEAATALIKIDNGSIGGFINSGSGFFIASSGEMLTANHVANDRDLAVQVVLADGSKHAAVVEFQNKKGDLTVLHVNGVKNHAFLPAGDSSKLEDGDTLVAVGYPFSIGKTVTSGIVSALDRSLPLSVDSLFIQTDAAMNPGNSGGPVVNTKGEFVGMADQLYSPLEDLNITPQNAGLGFAIPSNTICEKLTTYAKVSQTLNCLAQN
ncbi:MAG: trypsin-like peptidase domain-containing protein [Alphaproteobacteria bacterium]